MRERLGRGQCQKIANSTLHKGCQRPIMMKRVHLRTYHSLLYRQGTLGTKTLLYRIRIDVFLLLISPNIFCDFDLI